MGTDFQIGLFGSQFLRFNFFCLLFPGPIAIIPRQLWTGGGEGFLEQVENYGKKTQQICRDVIPFNQ